MYVYVCARVYVWFMYVRLYARIQAKVCMKVCVYVCISVYVRIHVVPGNPKTKRTHMEQAQDTHVYTPTYPHTHIGIGT